MLCLKQEVGQELLVGDVVVRVLEAQGGRARLGFDAPDSVRILRDELVRRALESEGWIKGEDGLWLRGGRAETTRIAASLSALARTSTAR